MKECNRRQFFATAARVGAGLLLFAGCSPHPETPNPEIKKSSRPVPPEKPDFSGIAEWETRGKIPQNSEEWKETIALFDNEITNVLGKPKITTPPAEICQFWPVLGENEKEKWTKMGLCESPDCKNSFTFRWIETAVSVDIKNKQVVLDSPYFTGLFLRIPEENEFSAMGEMGNFLSRLDPKSIFELGLILNLVNLRSGFGKETLWLSAVPSPDQDTVLRETWGFETVIVNLKNQEISNYQLTFDALDTWARLFSFWPHLEKTAPALWNYLCKICKTCKPLFFLLMKEIDVSSSEVWNYCQKGSLVEFMHMVGEKMHEKGIEVKDSNGPIENTNIIGLKAFLCIDTPTNGCNYLWEWLAPDKQGEKFPQRQLIINTTIANLLSHFIFHK